MVPSDTKTLHGTRCISSTRAQPSCLCEPGDGTSLKHISRLMASLPLVALLTLASISSTITQCLGPNMVVMDLSSICQRCSTQGRHFKINQKNFLHIFGLYMKPCTVMYCCIGSMISWAWNIRRVDLYMKLHMAMYCCIGFIISWAWNMRWVDLYMKLRMVMLHWFHHFFGLEY